MAAEDPHELAERLRELGWTVEPPDRSLVDELIEERREEATQEDIPYVAIGAGEQPPWSHLDHHCPTCGAGPLELQTSPGDKTTVRLSYIAHCGGAWMRGPIRHG